MATEKTGVYIYGVNDAWSDYSADTAISKFEVPGSEFTFTGVYKGDSITGHNANNILVCNANVTYAITANSNMCVYDTKVYGLDYAVNLTGGNAEIIDSYFSDSTSAALRIANSASTVMVSGSTFATSGDMIDNAGKLTFKNTNYINATLKGSGTYTLAENAGLVFGNSSAISVADLTFSGSNTLKFTGSGSVSFAAAEDFTGVSLLNNDGETVSSKKVTYLYGSIANFDNDDIGSSLNVYLPGTDMIFSGTYNGLAPSGHISTSVFYKTFISASSVSTNGEFFIYGSTISGSTNGLRLNANAKAYIYDSLFAASGKGLILRENATNSAIVSGSTFNNRIYVESAGTHTITFQDINLINADISVNSGASGNFVLAENAGLVFGNSGAISVADLTFSSGNTLTFNGDTVLFSGSEDFSGVSLKNDDGEEVSVLKVGSIYAPADKVASITSGTAVSIYLPDVAKIVSGTYNGTTAPWNCPNSFTYGAVIGEFFTNSTIHVYGSTITGGENYGLAVNKSGNANIVNTLFSGNAKAALQVSDQEGATATVSGSTFATVNDYINNLGSLTFKDTNYINAKLTGTGTYTLADNAKLVFNNEGYQIRVEELNFGNNNTLVLSGGHNGVNGNVDFANTNVFTNVDVVVDTDNMTFDNVDKKYQLAYGLVSPKSLTVDGAYKEFWEAFPANDSGNTQARLKDDIADTIVIDVLENGNAKLSVLGKDVETTTANAYALALKFIKSNGTLTLNDWQTIDGNGVNLNDLTVKLNNVNYTNCSGGNGGGFSGNATLTVKGGEFVSNKASNNGGAINVSGTADISGAEFIGNKATYNGGAVYVGTSGTVQISDSTFTGNIAGQRGGAVLSEALSGHESRSLTVFNSNFTGNEALYGGAVRAEIGSLVVCDTIFDRNASDSGGAVYLERSVAATISGSTFCGNIAAVGGAIASFLSSETLTIDGSTKAVIFDGNSSENGISGAIFSAYGKIVLTGDVEFLQGSDSIYIRDYQDLNYTGTLEITDANVILNASLQTKFSLAESGITVNSSSITFDNTGAINVAALTFTGTNTINLNGEVVNFTGQDLSGVNITVDTTGFAGGFKTIASGVSAIDLSKCDFGDKQLLFSNNKLILHDSAVNEVNASGIRESNTGSDLLTVVTGDFSGKQLFGGSESGTDGSLLMNFKSGTVSANIVGGGKVKAESTAIEIFGTAVAEKSVYAGIFATTAGLDTGSSSLTISGGSLQSYAVAGSRVHNVQHHTDLTTLTIDGGEFAAGADVFNAGFLVGGSNRNDVAENAAATLTVSKAVTNLSGATISGGIYGGASAHKNGYAKVDAVEINITGGSYGQVFGGGWAQQGSRSEVGSVNITIDGGYVANLYAGGSNAVSSSYGASGAVVTGDVAITVSTYDTLGNIYLCGKYTNSAVLGNVTLTLAGSNTIDLISGAGVNGVADANGITRVEVMGNVSCGEIDEIDQLAINENATLTMTGNFSGESLELLTDGVLDARWDILSASNIADLVDSLNFNIAGQDYSFESLAAGVDGIGIKLGIEENKLFAVSK